MITAERLRELLNYDSETGVFTRKISTSHRVKVGDVAGSINGAGYRLIRIDGHRYKAHRLAWLYVTCAWPRAEIDHINGVKDDNRLANLREATRSENLRNIGNRANNSSGFKGVRRHTEGRWEARIRVDGIQKYLGHFDTPEQAHSAYRAAATELHGDFARTE